MRRASRFLGVAALILAGLGLSAGASASSLPQLPTGVGCESHAQLRPTEVVLSCADDNSFLGSLRWTRWTASGATGTGRLMVNPCTPNCAESTVANRGAIRVVASDPTSNGAGRVFARLRVTRVSTGRSVTLKWAWASSLTQIGTWRGSIAPLLAAG